MMIKVFIKKIQNGRTYLVIIIINRGIIENTNNKNQITPTCYSASCWLMLKIGIRETG